MFCDADFEGGILPPYPALLGAIWRLTGATTGNLRELPFSLYYMLKADKQGNVLEIAFRFFFLFFGFGEKSGRKLLPEKKHLHAARGKPNAMLFPF